MYTIHHISALTINSCAPKIQVFIAQVNSHDIAMLFNSWFCPAISMSSAICDAIITIGIFIYLRPLRNSPFRYVYLVLICIISGPGHNKGVVWPVCTYYLSFSRRGTTWTDFILSLFKWA
ncbi:hypothetical protein J3A83DRAFT_4214841 [Scleroderma citrinum]